MFNNFFLNHAIRDNTKKYCRAGQATSANMAHKHCMLDTSGYRQTLTICNTYCFSTATTVIQTHLNVMSYGECPSCITLTISRFMDVVHYLIQKEHILGTESVLSSSGNYSDGPDRTIHLPSILSLKEKNGPRSQNFAFLLEYNLMDKVQ